MSRIRLLTSTFTRPALAMLAVLLLLSGLAFPGTARAQDETQIATCIPLELSADLAELDLEGVQAALQELVEADPEATVPLLFEGEEQATVRADLLLADEAVLAALLGGQQVTVTVDPRGEEELAVILAIEVATAEECEFPPMCVSGIELPAALADLDVAGLREALEELIAADADATVTVPIFGDEGVVRADVLIGLTDPVLGAVLAGETLSVIVSVQGGTNEIVAIALPGPECEDVGGAPVPDNQQDGGKDTTPDNQQGGGDKVPDNQQTGGDKDTGAGGKTPDNQQGGGKTPDNQQGGGGKEMVTKTFELTLNGDVPEGQAFFAQYLVEGQPEPTAGSVLFCADVSSDVPECEGDGTVYRESVQLPAGSGLDFRFIRSDEVGDLELFHEGNETLNSDMTNTAFYTFGTGAGDDQQEVPDNQQTGGGKDAGAGDDQQDDTQDNTQDEGTGAGDDQQVPDNQQDGEDKDTGSGAGDDVEDDTQEDVQDDQQGEMPEELPDTGAGGLATGASVPWGSFGLAASGLLAAGYAVLRRR